MARNRFNKRRAASGILLLAALLLIVGLVTGVMKVPGTGSGSALATPAIPAGAGCTSQLHYPAYDAPSGSHQFGPTVSDYSAGNASAVLDQSLCSDPLFTGVLVDFIANDSNLSAASAQAKGQSFAASQSAWQGAITQAKSEVVSESVEYDSNTYETLAMMPGSNSTEMPTLFKVDRPVTVGWVLVLHLKDGSVRKLRIVCHLQPVAENFPQVPPVPSTPPPVVVVIHHPSPNVTVVTATATATAKASCPNGAFAYASASASATAATYAEAYSKAFAAAQAKAKAIAVVNCPPGSPPPPPQPYCVTHPSAPQCLSPKDPSQDPTNNPQVPGQPKGPGTTPTGTSPGPATQPTDSPTGCSGACTSPTSTTQPAPSSTTTTLAPSSSSTSGDSPSSGGSGQVSKPPSG